MTEERKKQEPKLALDMDFGEALERFARTKPNEVAASIERAKQKKPPEDGAPRRPARGKRDGAASPGRKRRGDAEGEA